MKLVQGLMSYQRRYMRNSPKIAELQAYWWLLDVEEASREASYSVALDTCLLGCSRAGALMAANLTA